MEDEDIKNASLKLGSELVNKIVEYRKPHIRAEGSRVIGIPNDLWIKGYLAGHSFKAALELGIGQENRLQMIVIVRRFVIPNQDKESENESVEDLVRELTQLIDDKIPEFMVGLYAAEKDWDAGDSMELREYCDRWNRNDDILARKAQQLMNDGGADANLHVNALTFNSYKLTNNPHWLAVILNFTNVRFVINDEENDEIKKAMVETFSSHHNWESIV